MSRALLTLEKKTGQTDGRTDGRQVETLRFLLDAVNVVRSSAVELMIKSQERVFLRHGAVLTL